MSREVGSNRRIKTNSKWYRWSTFVSIVYILKLIKFFWKLETTIKQSDEEKQRALELAMRLKNEYKPLKESINYLRESIGLNKFDETEDDIITSFM